MKKLKGFTLVEIVLVLALLTFLIATLVVLINPNQQFAKARNNERLAEISSIVNAIGQNKANNTGVFICASGDIPTTTTEIGDNPGNYDIAPCITPKYLLELPIDPSTGTIGATGYEIHKNTTTSQITVTAIHSELEEIISVTR